MEAQYRSVANRSWLLNRAINVTIQIAIAGMDKLKSTNECSNMPISPTDTPTLSANSLLDLRAKSFCEPCTNLHDLTIPAASSAHAEATSTAPAIPQSASRLMYSLCTRSGSSWFFDGRYCRYTESKCAGPAPSHKWSCQISRPACQMA